jgi:hypothetical protein
MPRRQRRNEGGPIEFEEGEGILSGLWTRPDSFLVLMHAAVMLADSLLRTRGAGPFAGGEL